MTTLVRRERYRHLHVYDTGADLTVDEAIGASPSVLFKPNLPGFLLQSGIERVYIVNVASRHIPVTFLQPWPVSDVNAAIAIAR